MCDAFTQVRACLEEGRARPFVADAVWWHAGDAVASDASSSVDWGIVVEWFVFFGLWEQETLAAFEAAVARSTADGPPAGATDTAPEGASAEGAVEEPEETCAVGDAGEEVADADVERAADAPERVPISPAELLVAAYTVRAVCEVAGAEVINGCFYSRCDNYSAVRVVNARRARSAAMTEALRVVREQEIGLPGERRLRMRLERIGTLDSKVADLLSRGDVTEAMAVVGARWGQCEVRTLDEAFLRSAEKRVREATLKGEIAFG